MVSKNFKVLEIINGKEYCFSAFAFKASVRNFKAEKKRNGENIASEDLYWELAEATHVSADSIKNWMYAKNGPGDLQTVKEIANYLKIDYKDLLKEQEKQDMSGNDGVNQNAVDNGNTKDVIRVVYQKMSAFMDAAVQELCFDSDEATFYTYEAIYKDMVGTLHRSMLDIPIGIYDQLKAIAEGDLYMYMYGIPEGPADVWDLCEFHDFCEESGRSGVIAEMLFMENKADEFYTKMREILKDYLLA